MTMRNRKTIITAFVLAACLLIGVGYATLVDSLEVDGTTTITKDQAITVFDGDVYFSAATAQPKSGSSTTTNTTSIVADNNDKVTFTVNELAEKGDVATFVYEITNTSSFDVNLLASVTGNTTTVTDDSANNTTYEGTDSYFIVEYSLDTTTVAAATETVPGKAYLTVTVTLDKAISYYTKGSFTITITATSQNS